MAHESEFEIGRIFYCDASTLLGETPGEIVITKINNIRIYYDVLWGLKNRSKKSKETRHFGIGSEFASNLQFRGYKEEKVEIKFGFDELTGW